MLSIFLDIKKIDFWWKNADVSKYHGVCHAIYFFFWIFFRETDFREGSLSGSPPSVITPEKAHLE